MIYIPDRQTAMFGSIGAALADLIYPPSCAWCRVSLPPRSKLAFCHDCSDRLAPSVVAMCRHCSAPLHNPALDSKRCFHCARDSHPWHRAVALGRYRGELSQAILRTKRPRNEPLTIALAELLFVQRKESLAELSCDCIIPMPMHWLRRWRRGINGPELLAEVLAGRLKLPVKRRWLRRIRITPLQTDLSVTNRLRQQRGSFRASRIAPIRGRRILLVDDVLTTGATAAEAARMLLARGAEQVSLAAIARGLGDDAS